MRTTLTLENDVAARIEQLRRGRGASLCLNFDAIEIIGLTSLHRQIACQKGDTSGAARSIAKT